MASDAVLDILRCQDGSGPSLTISPHHLVGFTRLSPA